MNSDKLTHSDVAILTAPFDPGDHEFNRGFIYISEEAICQRIEAVDPSWEWRVESMTFENDMATVIGTLTICGVTRYGTGQQLAQIDKNGKESVGESRKGATTDAMKRAARLFGIGRYLLQCPKEVKGYGPELNKWLISLKGKQAPQAEPKQTPAPTANQQPVHEGYSFWDDLKFMFTQRMNEANATRAIAKMRDLYKTKQIDEVMGAAGVFDKVIQSTFVDGELLDDDIAVAYFESQAKVR